MDFEKYASDFLNGTSLQNWCILNFFAIWKAVYNSPPIAKKIFLIDSSEYLRRRMIPLSCMLARGRKPPNYSRAPKRIFKEKKFLTFFMKLTESGKLNIDIAKVAISKTATIKLVDTLETECGAKTKRPQDEAQTDNHQMDSNDERVYKRGTIVDELANQMMKDQQKKSRTEVVEEEQISNSAADNLSTNGVEDANDIRIQGILSKEIRVDEMTVEIVNIFNNFKSNNRQDLLAHKGVMDMTPKSVFVKQIPDELYKKYLMSLESFDLLIPEETHEFLVSFFEQDLTCRQWSDAVDALDNFLQAFSLEYMNPLQNAKALEAPHLNDYIHPCFKAALWQCANVYYEFGEIPSVHHVGQQKGDGSGLTVDADKYEIVYVEGSPSQSRR
ncbi:12687_t:CDS:10 [Ambispora gerdemannii]|uniref:12687_t:CDS:1 n=1 Tax=Ambispora gerdemannii TaxID=144530 RepID=A0A9N9GVN8_9GLOM|nr:12687_t:CDS:10 [Ambispora gerdemannii]